MELSIFRQIQELLMPYAAQKFSELRGSDRQFAHYTSAFAALQIIQKKQVWMRNASIMNDYSEIDHGHDCLNAAWKSKSGVKLQRLLNDIQDGLADDIAKSFDQRKFERDTESYLISISEHGSGTIDESKYGRLSMWRAYGGDTNVAFVFKKDPFISESDATNAYTSPVFYGDEKAFIAEFDKVVSNFEQNIELAKSFGAENIKNTFQMVFHFAALSTKHPGFAEEREWRVILSPTIYGTDKVNFDLETIQDVPQKVYKFPLQNFPENNFVGATLPELLDEIIIGPTEFSFTIYDALVHALENENVENAREKVRVSNIPLRR